MGVRTCQLLFYPVATDAEDEDLREIMREEKRRGKRLVDPIQMKKKRRAGVRCVVGYRVMRLARVCQDVARSRDEGRDARVRERFEDFPCFGAPALSATFWMALRRLPCSACENWESDAAIISATWPAACRTDFVVLAITRVCAM